MNMEVKLDKFEELHAIHALGDGIWADRLLIGIADIETACLLRRAALRAVKNYPKIGIGDDTSGLSVEATLAAEKLTVLSNIAKRIEDVVSAEKAVAEAKRIAEVNEFWKHVPEEDWCFGPIEETGENDPEGK